MKKKTQKNSNQILCEVLHQHTYTHTHSMCLEPSIAERESRFFIGQEIAFNVTCSECRSFIMNRRLNRLVEDYIWNTVGSNKKKIYWLLLLLSWLNKKCKETIFLCIFLGAYLKGLRKVRTFQVETTFKFFSLLLNSLGLYSTRRQ